MAGFYLNSKENIRKTASASKLCLRWF